MSEEVQYRPSLGVITVASVLLIPSIYYTYAGVYDFAGFLFLLLTILSLGNKFINKKYSTYRA